MNHTYRLVWNTESQRHVPAPESARARGKCGGKTGRPRLKPIALLLGACLAAPALPALAAPPAAGALPTGGQVVAGQAALTQGSNALTVQQTSQRAIIDWQTFNIGSEASVRFIQPSASAVALNRVLAGEASQIYGKLSANGQVYLVNPAGIVFGAGSRVDVGGLVASTLDITNEDFLAGRAVFRRNGASGGIVNRGKISAKDGGLVALLAPTVQNEGIVSARLGNVVLAAGDRLTLEAGADGRLQVAIDPATVRTLIENRQLIAADGGQVLMTSKAADALSAGVVANTGTVRAQTLQEREGRILLLADMQHGEVRHAGLLDASAPNGGNGGFVETSAAVVTLPAGRRVSTAAANGRTGTWLIDPNDYTIAASGGDITGSDLSNDLASSNVTISTATQGTAGGNGDIHVNDAVGWSANKLTLSAGRDININANLNGSGSAKLELQYGQGAVAAGNSADYHVHAQVNLPAGASFSTKLGSDGTTKNYTVITSLGAAGSTTAADLQGMNGYLTGNYALGADIDASATSGWNGGSGWTPVGSYDGGEGAPCTTCFRGTFAGLGHTVSGLTINRPGSNYQAMFGETGSSAHLRDLGLIGGSVTGRWGAAPLVGRMSGVISNSYATGAAHATIDVAGGLVGASIGEISNSHATGPVTADDGRVGGLAGSNYGSIRNSYASGNVSGDYYVGGLVGDNYSNAANITDSHATGAVSGNSSIGGLVGNNSGTISNSYASGVVSGTYNVGGLVGEHAAYFSTPLISNSYATGAVSGQESIGGLVGGGYDSTITNSYSTGAVTDTSGSAAWIGGLVGGGSTSSIVVNNSFWDTQTSGRASSAGGTGMTTAQMKALANFNSATAANGSANPGWDISGSSGGTTVWRIYEGQSYPVLRDQQRTLTVTANDAAKTYDGNAWSGGNGVVYSASGAPLTGTLSYGGSSQGATNAGSYAITPGGQSLNRTTQQDYQTWGDLAYVNGTLTIDPAVLTAITGNLTGTVSKTYDGSNAATLAPGNFLLSGWVGSDGASVTKTAGTYNNASAGSNKTVTVTLTGGDYNATGSTNLGNYSLPTSISGNVGTILAKPITVNANTATKIYGNADPSLSWQLTAGNLVGSDTLSGSLARASGENVGSYAINQGTLSNGNYLITFNGANLTIAQCPITVGADARSKIYGDADPALTWQLTAGNLVGSDSLSGSLARASGENVGSYAINQGTLANGNYQLTFNGNTLTIAAAASSSNNPIPAQTSVSSAPINAGTIQRIHDPAPTSGMGNKPPAPPALATTSGTGLAFASGGHLIVPPGFIRVED